MWKGTAEGAIITTATDIKIMMNLSHILEGWGKSLGLLEVTEQNKKLSCARMAICTGCEHARESSFLKIIGREAHDIKAVACTKCGCPVNEKTLVTTEKCPIGLW